MGIGCLKVVWINLDFFGVCGFFERLGVRSLLSSCGINKGFVSNLLVFKFL